MTTNEPANPMLAAALGYAARGWNVFPLKAGTKGRDHEGNSTHHLLNGHIGASRDPEQIRSWWARWPDANIGLNLAASGLVAIDIDAYKPECQWEEFIAGRNLPDTLRQRSPSGGMHHIFRAEPGRRYPGKLCAGVDVKHNGYVLVASSTFDGRPYSFENDLEPGVAPEWLGQEHMKMSANPGAGTNHHKNNTREVSGSTVRASISEVEELLSWIDPDADGYGAWIEMLQGLHDHFDGRSDGLALAETWSSRGAKFRLGEVASKWRGFTTGAGVTIRTIAGRARANGADLAEITRRHRWPKTVPHDPDEDGGISAASSANHDDPPDLSHDHLALDLGRRSWDANARHVATWGEWLFWTGTFWERDRTLDHLSRTRSYLRTRAAELEIWADCKAADLERSGEMRQAGKLRTWSRDQGKLLRSNATVTAVNNLARANAASACPHDTFDRNLFLLGTPGGTVDLRTGALRTARRDDMISRVTAVAPAEPGVRPDLFERFLSEIFEGDSDVIDFLQRVAGYALTGSTTEHKLLFLHGAGRNGKSVFLNTLLYLWGDYGRRVAASTFLNSQTERHPTDVAGLQGARLAVASELPRGKTWDEAVIKDLTGGDRMTARFMRQDFFDFDPQLTLMIAGNTQPSFRGVDEAIRARVVLVPFKVTIPPERRDKGLEAKLKAEGPAILRWCIDGALAWQERGLDVPKSILAASQAYFDEEDVLGLFLQDETHPDPQAFLSSEALGQRFEQWCTGQGLTTWTQRTLIKELRQRGYADAKSNGRRGLRGLVLR